jgi:hemoglobin/transferrin/lactoferrin receptor protein
MLEIKMSIKKLSLLSFAIFAASLSNYSSTSFAEEQPTENVDENIIVILGKIPRPIGDVLGSVSVITSETIEKELVHNISDLVRYQTGISIESSGTRFGFSGYSIRGLGGNRVTTEIDGIPVASQFDIGSYSNSGRNFIDTDMIQQVEILKGPASSVYGSNAIGGVVSYVTKKPVELLSESESDIYLGFKSGYYSVDNSRLLSVKTAFGNSTSSALFSVSSRSGSEFKNQASADAGVDSQDNESLSFMAKYFYVPSLNHEFSLSFDYFNRESESDINSFIGQGRFRSTTALTGDDETERKNIALSYNFLVENPWVEGGVVRIFDQGSDIQQLTDETRFSRGTNYFYDRDFFYNQDVEGIRLNFYAYQSTASTTHTIGYGLEYSNTTITELRNTLQTNLDTGATTNVVLSEQFPLRDFPISKVKNTGVYINDEIVFTGTNWSIIPALRYDRYELSPQSDAIYLANNSLNEVVSIIENSFSPKLGVQYELSDNSGIYFQYARGFRAPPFEDANIALDIPMFNIRAIPNPDLVSETSNGFELGYSLSNSNFQFDAVAFYTDYKDFILTKVNLGFDPVSGRVLFQSQNVDKAKIYGAELSYRYQKENWFKNGDSLSFYSHLFWSEGNNKDTSEPLNTIEPSNLLLGINWLSSDADWSISLHANIYEAKDNIDEPEDVELFKTSGYATVDVMANYSISDNITISMAINNLTDRKYWQWTDVNGMLANDPILESLSSAGINGSIQLSMQW